MNDVTIVLNFWNDDNCIQLKQFLEANKIDYLINNMDPIPTDVIVIRPYLSIIDDGSKMYYTLEEAEAALTALMK